MPGRRNDDVNLAGALRATAVIKQSWSCYYLATHARIYDQRVRDGHDRVTDKGQGPGERKSFGDVSQCLDDIVVHCLLDKVAYMQGSFDSGLPPS